MEEEEWWGGMVGALGRQGGVGARGALWLVSYLMHT